jgi:glycosyltransferase involved in cell wall biosynthesis
MVNSVNFFEIVDNFNTTAHIVSIPIFEAKLSFSPEITIAIPTYKRSKYLKEAINSAINQMDHSNYDIIVVDNNPERNDETEKLMTTYKQNFIISYYKNAENIQMAGNWNRLYTLAKGKYVVMLHDDDLLYPNYLSSIFPIIEKSEYDVYCPQFVKYDMRNEKSLPVQFRAKLKCVSVTPLDFMYCNIIGPPIGMCIKKNIFIATGGFSSRYYPSPDYDYFAKISKYYKVCKIIGYPFSIYRIAENESLKTETLLAFAECDKAIKKGIIANKNVVIKKIWNSHAKVFIYKYLEYVEQKFNINVTEKKIINKYNIIDYIIYKGLNCRRKLLYIYIQKFKR